MTRIKHGLRPTHPNHYYHLGNGVEYRHAPARRRRFLKPLRRPPGTPPDQDGTDSPCELGPPGPRPAPAG